MGAEKVSAAEIKTCCAEVYASEWARLLLGDSFHPGGMGLTERLGQLLGLEPGMRVLDVAAGAGASAICLAQRFGVEVLGIDYSAEAMRAATVAAQEAGVGHRVRFEQGDAERLTVADGAFDAVICECAFCTFPDKAAAAGEFRRVLCSGGRVGLSDLTRREGPVPTDLQGLLAWIACIADAQPAAAYERYLGEAGLRVDGIEPHADALADVVRDLRSRLLGAELLARLKRIELPGADFEQARTVARAAADAVRDGTLGYSIFVARRTE